MHFISLIFLIVMYGLTAYAVFAPENWQPMLGSINAISIVLFIIYVILVIKQPKESEPTEKTEIKSDMTLKSIIIWFIVCSIFLIGASICITYVTDLITKELPWLSCSVVGAILLCVGTPLPEVISTFSLFRKKNFDAGYGNMIGSCTFNFSNLAIADFISWKNWNGELITKRGIFISTTDSKQLVIFGLITTIALGSILAIKLFSKFFEEKKSSAILCGFLAAVAFTSYLLVFII